MDRLAQLRNSAPAVLPSLLMCDFGNLEREVDRLQAAGVECLHLDVMDGRFVPNISYGFPIVEALRRLTDMALDVHLNSPFWATLFFSSPFDRELLSCSSSAEKKAIFMQSTPSFCPTPALAGPSRALDKELGSKKRLVVME